MLTDSRSAPTSISEVHQYLAHDKIECLECSKRFSFLPHHLKRAHGMTSAEYREQWRLPASTPLAGKAYREAHSRKLQAMHQSGAINYDHLPDATEAARSARRYKQGLAHEHHRKRVSEIRPGDHHLLPPGAKTADGRDADRRREYQRAYRAAKSGNDSLMRKWRSKYNS